jgi:GT2 family glycosyltransferase
MHLLHQLQPGLMKNLNVLNEPYEWRIRSNGCKDGTQDIVWNDTRVIPFDHNRDSFSTGMNSILMDVNDSDTILFLNNDVRFISDNVLLKMKELLTKNIGIVGTRLMYPSTNEEERVQHKGVAFSATQYGSMPWHIGAGESLKPTDKMNRYYQAVTAACCMVRGSVWNENKGFSEDYRWSFEDVDFCLRAGARGWRIISAGLDGVEHGESVSLKKNPVNKLFMKANVDEFKSNWWKDGRPTYQLDYDRYQDLSYMLVK